MGKICMEVLVKLMMMMNVMIMVKIIGEEPQAEEGVKGRWKELEINCPSWIYGDLWTNAMLVLPVFIRHIVNNILEI